MSKQVSAQFTNGMKQWIQMDMKMSEHFKSIREIREKKKAVEVQLVNYMASNELTNTSIKLLNQKVTFLQILVQILLGVCNLLNQKLVKD